MDYGTYKAFLKKPCDKCLKPSESRLQTVYGSLLCEDCWDDYLFTDEGKVEYIVGIIRGDYPMEYFDADFLGHCAVQWQKHKGQFNISDEGIAHIEHRAKCLGLMQKNIITSVCKIDYL